MSRCIYALATPDGSGKCSLKLCEGKPLSDCCDSCSEYAGPDRGLGDKIKNVASAVGFKPCQSCQARRERLNRWSKRRQGKQEEKGST